jgi:MoaA/NifB/PqqE/SkfB family radical SAM enzyme
MISKALFPILQVLAGANVAIQLFTNGLLLKSAAIERLKAIPLNFVQISLDSATPDYHNRYRGSSHALALRGIKALRKAGIPVVIGANIFPDTLAEVQTLAELADSLGATLRCNPIEARGRGTQFEDKDTVVNESLTASVARAVGEVSERWPHVFAEQEVRQSIEASERICPFSKGCIAVTALAEIRPCSQADSFFESVAPWAIDRKKAWEYVKTMEEHTAFRTVAQIQPEVCPTHETCAGCSKYPICAGCLLAGHTCQERR